MRRPAQAHGKLPAAYRVIVFLRTESNACRSELSAPGKAAPRGGVSCPSPRRETSTLGQETKRHH